MTKPPAKTQRPTYDLREIKELLSDPDARVITRRDRKEAAELGYPSDDEMVARVNSLRATEFQKTMECLDEHFVGLWQDVYKTSEPSGIRLYIKLQKNYDGDGVLISFKKDTGHY
jgi:hypothetical protein